MPDRIDREIEEILSRLGEEPPKRGEEPPKRGEEPPRRGEEPISIDERRRRRKAPLGSRATAAFGLSLSGPTPASMLYTGAGVMVVGLILSAIWGTLIWVAFVGVLVFVAAFIWSFVRPRRAGVKNQPAAKGAHWRGRYVEYEPPPPGVLARIRRAFRRR
ncbi:MAG: hypothetical protein OXE43_09375 [Chloroflexi bacterium]|nr:hypothetical protein [Chloroflexota bacterium]